MAPSQFFSSVSFVFLQEINGWRGWVQTLIFFLIPWIQCSPCFFFLPPHFFSNFLHTCCPVVFHICAMPYFLVILLLLLYHHRLLSIVFRGKKKVKFLTRCRKSLKPISGSLYPFP
ncbi:unnamed protein product [Tuber melanosporum]|uniref:(Perigord truffle) hypothetical protein n=1 Tax=Tuber melanosporum (strain Mel28) TaxID=656061 RepID=D5GA34_TUBMM|nr:uncharacterized protein GSTUM_00003550001 [Tuber melanosporum]CAZ81377.1 unnamed protein product [Tuber melanosporum]